MNRFRSSHPNAPTGADDPTEVLRSWRDQQREERLADTREFPALAGPAGAPTPRGRHRVPVLLVAGVGALVVVAGVAVASADDGRGGQATSGAAVSTAAPTAPTSPSAEVTAPPSSAGSTDSTDTPRPGAAGGPVDGPPAPPPGGRGPGGTAPGPR